MDPVHRASVWRIIERVKRDRVVVLTTHSMLEAEALGDRVAIMAGGKVQVSNSFFCYLLPEISNCVCVRV